MNSINCNPQVNNQPLEAPVEKSLPPLPKLQGKVDLLKCLIFSMVPISAIILIPALLMAALPAVPLATALIVSAVAFGFFGLVMRHLIDSDIKKGNQEKLDKYNVENSIPVTGTSRLPVDKWSDPRLDHN